MDTSNSSSHPLPLPYPLHHDRTTPPTRKPIIRTSSRQNISLDLHNPLPHIAATPNMEKCKHPPIPLIQFTRKSVEGLSILLFIFAFCGNIAYVLSILLNPSGGSDPSETNHYLLEALP